MADSWSEPARMPGTPRRSFAVELSTCRSEDALSEAKSRAETAGVKWIEIVGQIEATAVIFLLTSDSGGAAPRCFVSHSRRPASEPGITPDSTRGGSVAVARGAR
ncbi:MAG: hypothetical protein ACRD1X_16245 [Vicinamibacteria bacterium]